MVIYDDGVAAAATHREQTCGQFGHWQLEFTVGAGVGAGVGGGANLLLS